MSSVVDITTTSPSAIVTDSRSDERNSLNGETFPQSQRGNPTWEMALDYPHQGEWTEEAYLSLGTGRLIEYTDGVLEFLPMPKMSHALISQFISDLLRAHVTSKALGYVFWAPLAIRVGPKKLREPDILYLSQQRMPQGDVPPDGADLVIEVVSEGVEHRRRDLETKRDEYSEAGIPEYWIVDPALEIITVLALKNGHYEIHGEFRTESIATSVLLPGFAVDVGAAFSAGKLRP